VVWDIPPQMTQLLPGLPRHASVSANGITRARQGANSWLSENIGYRGPAPPEGHGVHHYRFRLYALDTRLKLRAGATKDDLLRAARQHVLGEAELVGTYERPG
jgi:Raf kinase inhibitor-like YbhB/YbcL family protein